MTTNYDAITTLQNIEAHAKKHDLYAYTTGPTGLVALPGGRFGRFFAWIGHCLGIRTNAQLIHKFARPCLDGLALNLALMRDKPAPDYALVGRVKIFAKNTFYQENFKERMDNVLELAELIDPFEETPDTFDDTYINAAEYNDKLSPFKDTLDTFDDTYTDAAKYNALFEPPSKPIIQAPSAPLLSADNALGDIHSDASSIVTSANDSESHAPSSETGPDSPRSRISSLSVPPPLPSPPPPPTLPTASVTYTDESAIHQAFIDFLLATFTIPLTTSCVRCLFPPASHIKSLSYDAKTQNVTLVFNKEIHGVISGVPRRSPWDNAMNGVVCTASKSLTIHMDPREHTLSVKKGHISGKKLLFTAKIKTIQEKPTGLNITAALLLSFTNEIPLDELSDIVPFLQFK